MRIDGAAKATAQLVRPRSRALRLVAHQGFPAEFLDFFEIVNDTTTACGSALVCGTPVLISDITKSPVFAGTPGLEVMLGAGSRAVASLPVRAPHDRAIAMISTHHTRTTTWNDRRIRALHDLCASTGLLLHHLLERPGPQRP
jgi:GAF domain-containing protein